MKNLKTIFLGLIIVILFFLSCVTIVHSNASISNKNANTSPDLAFNVQRQSKESSNIVSALKRNPIPNTGINNRATQQVKTTQTTVTKQDIQSLSTLPVGPGTTGFISTWNTSEPGISNSTQITLPLVYSGKYNFNVSWGDGLNDTITFWRQSAVTHTYSSSGIYTVNITGTINGWQFNNGGDKLKIIEISQWGNLTLGNSGFYFDGASNLVLTANDSLNLNGTTNLMFIFGGCSKLGSASNIDNWNVSQVTDMNGMFDNAFSFNGSLSNWNVSQVTIMALMFNGASSFNQPLDNWNVSQVTDTDTMFASATSFNQPLDNWNVSQVEYMGSMFTQAYSFDQPLDKWNVSQVKDMSWMFLNDQKFNQSLGNWNVSKVTDMMYMFDGASFFDQPLGNWNVSQVTDMSDMFSLDTLSTANYDNLLIGWSSLTLMSNVTFNAGFSKYSSSATSARNSIISNFNWTITDGGLVVSTPISSIPTSSTPASSISSTPTSSIPSSSTPTSSNSSTSNSGKNSPGFEFLALLLLLVSLTVFNRRRKKDE